MTKSVAFVIAPLLALAACTAADPTTSTTSQDVASTVTVTLWDPDKDNTIDAFWDRPGGVPVASMQYLIQKGDAGGPLTRNNPTTYVWLVSNATSVFKVWRVANDQYGQFWTDLRVRHGAVLNAHPNFSNGGAGTPDGGDTPVGPHIGPHGDGDTFFSQALVDQAVVSAGQIKNAWAGFKAQAALETGN